MTSSLLDHWEKHLGKRYHLRINNNRSTMLSVRRSFFQTRVSLHRIFLDAPLPVLDALVGYVKKKRNVTLPPVIRSYIEESMHSGKVVYTLSPHQLDTQGKIHDLVAIYQDVNQTYFDGALNLNITWFGKENHYHRSSLSLGLYHEPSRLVKVHRKLDHAAVPHTVVAFIIYHEMCHHVCPSYVDEEGMTRVHTPEFRQLEAKFREFAFAEKWIAENKHYLFRKRGMDGRT